MIGPLIGAAAGLAFAMLVMLATLKIDAAIRRRRHRRRRAQRGGYLRGAP